MSNRIVIIGAGVAGLICAQILLKYGFNVTIFDKSRGPGGRVASRRIENGVFNHGASSIPDFRVTTSLPKFVKEIFDKAITEGILIPHGKKLTAYSSMKTFTNFLCKGIKIKKSAEIIAIEPTPSGINLFFKASPKISLGQTILIFAIPQPQVLKLLNGQFLKLNRHIETAEMYTSISGLFAFEKPIAKNNVNLESKNIIAYHENSRIGQNLDLDCWTIHSKKLYGQNSSHASKDEIRDLLLEDFKNLGFDCVSTPAYSAGHKWLYGFTDRHLNVNCLFDTEQNIGICGDWCRGDTVLDAAISGASLAEKIISFDIE